MPHAGFPSAAWLQMCSRPAQAGVGMGGELSGGLLLWCASLGTPSPALVLLVASSGQE